MRQHSVPSHYLNQCWFIINWTRRNKLQWNFNQNTKVFIHENASENIVCEMAAVLSWGRWVLDNTDEKNRRQPHQVDDDTGHVSRARALLIGFNCFWNNESHTNELFAGRKNSIQTGEGVTVNGLLTQGIRVNGRKCQREPLVFIFDSPTPTGAYRRQ